MFSLVAAPGQSWPARPALGAPAVIITTIIITIIIIPLLLLSLDHYTII